MIRLLENGQLITDLDFQNKNLKNIKFIKAGNITSSDDIRLTDKRPVPVGSVTDASVNAVAKIDQSKLSLNGNIPTPWLGTGANQAAQGNLATPTSGKGANNGYAQLDSNAKLPVAKLPTTGPQVGTVTEVHLRGPGEFNELETDPPAVGLALSWSTFIPDNSWFGVNGSVAGLMVPSFVTKLIPMGIIPSLDASKFTTGTFTVARLPVVVGMGASHAVGILPDTGALGDPTDYFGRDGTWKSVTASHDYQPKLPPVQITLMGAFKGQLYVKFFCPTPGSSIFYLSYAPVPAPGTTPYIPIDNPTTLLFDPGDYIYAYAAKAGYNNSDVATYIVPATPDTSSI